MLVAKALGLIALTSHVLAKEMAPNSRTESLYRSGAFMQRMMAQKEVHPIIIYLRKINLTESRQRLLDNGQPARTSRPNIQKLTVPSHASMAWQLQFLGTQTTRSAAIT
jgi:hypothetical protein